MTYLILSIVSLVLCVVSGFFIVVGNIVLVNKPWENLGDGFWSEQLATNVRNTSIVLLVVFVVLAIVLFVLFLRKKKNDKRRKELEEKEKNK